MSIMVKSKSIGEYQFTNDVITDSKRLKTVDYSKFRIVRETMYSSVRPYHFIQIEKILKCIFDDPKLIIDACAHIGGSTINMANTFHSSKLISVEIQKNVFRLLRKNITSFGYQGRVIPVNSNCIPFFKKIHTYEKNKPDFINIDPPWGGPAYTKIKKLMLTLNDISGVPVQLYDIINDIFLRDITEFVTFKAPVNFDMSLFKKEITGIVMVYPIYNEPRYIEKKATSMYRGKTLIRKKGILYVKTSKKKCTRRIAYYYVVVKKRSM